MIPWNKIANWGIKTGKKVIIKEGAKESSTTLEEIINEGSLAKAKDLNIGEEEFLEKFNKMSKEEQEEYIKKVHTEQERVRLEKEAQEQLPPELNIPEAPQSEGAEIMENLVTESDSIELKKQELFEEINRYNNEKEDILYKNLDTITQSELDEAVKFGNYESKDAELRQAINDKATSWFCGIK
ncbi:MAG: hypothetical protein R3Y43_08220 [Alphaproteobacteria bacterium]